MTKGRREWENVPFLSSISQEEINEIKKSDRWYYGTFRVEDLQSSLLSFPLLGKKCFG